VRVAGVRLGDGSALWVDAGTWQLGPLDTVLVHTSAGTLTGAVFVLPEHLLRPVERVDGIVLEVFSSSPAEERCADMPGSDLPYLGSIVRTGDVEGRVAALDPIRRLATLALDDGSRVEVPVDDLHAM
jgi:hypothetical protein